MVCFVSDWENMVGRLSAVGITVWPANARTIISSLPVTYFVTEIGSYGYSLAHPSRGFWHLSTSF